MVLRIAFALVSFVALTSNGYAEDRTANDLDLRRAMAAEANEIGGLRIALDKWRSVLIAQDASAACACNVEPKIREKLYKSWQHAVAQGFDVDKIAGDIRAALSEQLTAADLKAVVDFDKTQLGQKITAATLGSKSSKDDAKSPDRLAAEMAKLAAAAKTLAAHPRRAAVIAELVEVTDAVKGHIDAMMSVSIGSLKGTAAAMPPSRPQMPDDQVAELIENQRRTMQAAFESMMPAAFESMYAAISTQDLKIYAAWRKTAAARNFQRVQDASFIASLRAISEKIGGHFARSMEGDDI